ncbi:MAG TPA: papain-like cysteine protease family protein [Polyangia bacterium]|nr:papain-like cysteine protease family protein [Polyangia bacterium]
MALTGLALLAGCYTGSARTVSPAIVTADPGWLLVRGVPFFQQGGELDCGPAALAMVLRYWGVPVTPDQIASAHPQSRARGLRAGELRSFARGRGLEAFLVAGQPADLRAELESGRPLIVGLGKPHFPQRLAHYEVLIGLHPDGRVLTLDPAHGWRVNTVQGFVEEWASAQQLALVIFRRTP